MRTRELLVALVATSIVLAQDAAVTWSPRLQDTLERARASKRMVLIDFSNSACEPCRRLASTTWQDRDMNAWIAANALAVRVDPEAALDVAGRYQVNAYPTVLLLDAAGAELGRVLGYADAAAMLARLGGMLDAMSTDWAVRERVADELLQAGDKDGALTHYLWLWDHGLEQNPSRVGVRLSFFVSKLGRFARTHPPALQALEARRDAAERRVATARRIELDDVQVAVSLNKEFGTEARLAELFDRVPDDRWQHNAIVRDVLLAAVLPQLIDQRRYEDAVRHIGDPIARLDRDIRLPIPLPAEVQRARRLRAIRSNAQYLEAYLGAGETATAEDLADRLLDMDDGVDTWLALIAAAQRAGKDVTAHDYAVRALQELDEADQPRIRQAIKQR